MLAVLVLLADGAGLGVWLAAEYYSPQFNIAQK